MVRTSAAAIRAIASSARVSASNPPSILDAACLEVPRHGFSDDALHAASPDLPSVTLNALFAPQGRFARADSGPRQALLQHWLSRANEQAVSSIDAGLTGPEAVRSALRARMRANADPEIRPHLRPAIDTLLLRSDPRLYAQHLSNVADRVCWAAFPTGDQGTLWYARRARIAPIYGAVEAHQFRDDSPDDRATMALLDRLLDGSQSVVDLLNNTTEFGLHILRSWRGLIGSKGF